MNIDKKLVAGMTPTAIKLYQFATSRSLPASISFEDAQRLCGIDGVVPGWQNELERVCRELVSANVVKNAYAADGLVYFSN